MRAAIDIRSSGFKRYFANTSWLMGHRMLSMVVALFVGVYVARYLGPVRFGLLSYAGSFVGLFTALATLGLDGIMVRELVKTPERRDEVLGTAFWLKAGGAILMWVAIAAAIPFTHNDTQTNILIIIIAFAVIFQAFNVIDFNYQAEVKSKYVVYAQIVSLVISSITKLVFVWIAAPLVWFACVFLLDAVVRAMGLFAMYLQNTGKVWHWEWRWQTAKELLRDSWPLILSGMAVVIYMRIDQVMIKEMLGAKEVGLYAVAARLSEAWYFVPMAITQSLFPSIVKSKRQSEHIYNVRMQKLHDLIVWLAIFIALLSIFFSNLLVNMLFGIEYEESGNVLAIHMWIGVFVAAAIVRGKELLVENALYLITISTALGGVLVILLNYVFIPVYGINGAAGSTLGARIIAYFLIPIVFNKYKKLNQRFFTSLRLYQWKN